MTNCKCSGPGYCKSLGRHMPEARWRECHEQPEYCEMFHSESESGKYQSESYQYSHSPGHVAKTAISLSRWRIAQNAAQNAGIILFGSNAHNSQIDTRANICRTCEFNQNDACALCGCGLKAKQSRQSMFCPVLKWDGDVERFGKHHQNGKVAVGITTCPRKSPTLDATMKSLADAGFKKYTVIYDKKREGAWNTFRRGLAQLIASNPNASAYLMFQDDVIVAKGLSDYLPNILWPDERTGVIYLYCSGIHRCKDHGLNRGRGVAFGALALVFTPLSARMLIATTEMQKYSAGIDTRLSRWCEKNGLSYWIHWPSLIEHTGHTSTIHSMGMNRNRRASRFCDDCSNLQAENR